MADSESAWRSLKYTSDAVKNIRRSVFRDHFPPQSGIVLAFVNPPDIYFESKVVGSKRAVDKAVGKRLRRVQCSGALFIAP